MAQKPDLRNQGGPANAPVAAGGIRAFIDPATGQLVEPTEAQLRELQLQLEQQTGAIPAPSEVVRTSGVERRHDGRRPDVALPDGQGDDWGRRSGTLQESQSQGDAQAVATAN